MVNKMPQDPGIRSRAWGRAGFVLGMIVLLSAPSAARDSQAEIPTMDDPREIEADYLRTIRPSPVDAGSHEAITGGSVILYGQWVEPPYELVIRDQTLLLNGVRIDPPILPPWKRHPREITPSETARQISELSGRIRSAHAELLQTKDGADAAPALRRYISRAEESVADAVWESPEKLHVVLKNGAEFSIGFRQLARRPDPVEVRGDILRAMKRRYEAGLEAGALLVIGCGPVLTVPERYREETGRRIEEALSGHSLEELDAVLHHEELAREMSFVRAARMEEE